MSLKSDNAASSASLPHRSAREEHKLKVAAKLHDKYRAEWRKLRRSDQKGIHAILELASKIKPKTVGTVRMNCFELDDVWDLANESGYLLHPFCKDITNECNGMFEKGKRKLEDRVVAKVENEYGNDYGRILDVERCMAVFTEPRDMLRCLRKVQELTEYPIVRHGTTFSVRRFKDRFNHPVGEGYRDILMNIQIGEDEREAFIGEFQITFEGMLHIKEQAHILYGLDRLPDTDDEKPSTSTKSDDISSDGKARADDNEDDRKVEAVRKDVEDVRASNTKPPTPTKSDDVGSSKTHAEDSKSEAVSVDGCRRHGWTATSSAWAVGLFVLILFVVSRSKVGSPILVIGVKDWLSRLKSTLSKGDDVSSGNAKEETLLIVGGSYGGSYLSSVEELNTIKGDSFVSAKSFMQEKRFGHCAAVIDRQVYVAGGYNGTSILGSVERYDPKVGKWTLLPDKMNTPRSSCAAAAVNGRLYVIGGVERELASLTGIARAAFSAIFGGGIALDSVERFDPKSESWSVVAKMRSKRYGSAAVSFGGKVYVMGGWDGSNDLNSGEVFDPIKNEWSPLPATMNTKRWYCAAAVLGDKIYVAGGFDGSSFLNSVEVYDPGAGTWSLLSTPMNTKRYGCAVAVMGGKLFVAGGYNYSVRLDSVEVYDPATKRWTVMKMGSKRGGCAAVVV